MRPSHKFRPVSSIRKFFILFALTLLLTGTNSIIAQNNTNSPNTNNSNSGNLNNSANRSSNGNGNGNINGNNNTSQNGNTNRNANSNSNQNGAGTSSTPADPIENRKDRLANSNVFFGLVCLMFIGVLALTGYAIYRGVRYSRSTYNSPLGLPDGSLRAMLAYTLVAFLGFYTLAGILSVSDFKPPEFLLGIVATVIGFYFGSRSGEDKVISARTAGSVQGSITDKTGAAAGGANVELSQSDGKKLTQKADANGKYKFENVPAGDYDLQATLTGHVPSDIAKVKMTASAAQTVNLSLK